MSIKSHIESFVLFMIELRCWCSVCEEKATSTGGAGTEWGRSREVGTEMGFSLNLCLVSIFCVQIVNENDYGVRILVMRNGFL